MFLHVTEVPPMNITRRCGVQGSMLREPASFSADYVFFPPTPDSCYLDDDQLFNVELFKTLKLLFTLDPSLYFQKYL